MPTYNTTSRLSWPAVALALAATTARAEEPSLPLAPTSPAAETPVVDVPAGAVSAARPRATLTVEPAFFGLYGVALVRDGVEVGPGFLTLGLADAVRGSDAATAHAVRAQRWAFVNLGLTAAALGLAAGSLATYAESRGTVRGWPDLLPPAEASATPSVLAVGMVVSLVGAVVARYATYEEVMLSVSAYQAAQP